MAAITHRLETYLLPLVKPPAEAIAIDGLERTNFWIQIAVTDGSNKAARWHIRVKHDATRGRPVIQSSKAC